VTEVLTRPVLRYHGGKWRLAPWIIGHFPPHRIYTEAFGGAASVLLRKDRTYSEVYNDLDGEVVNLFRVLRSPTQAQALERLLRLTPFAREEFVREEFVLSYEPSSDPVEQARRTVTRSFMGFGSAAVMGRPSGFRANSDRSGTTPAHDWRNLPQALPAITRRLAGVVIEQRSALDILRQHDRSDALHYVDPPYVHETRAAGNPYCGKHYYRHELTDEQHVELAATLHDLQGAVVLSGYPSELYRRLYGDWHQVKHRAYADGARTRVEVLWLNPAAVRGLGQVQPGLSMGGGV
jgi:DNA adenine methylase